MPRWKCPPENIGAPVLINIRPQMSICLSCGPAFGPTFRKLPIDKHSNGIKLLKPLFLVNFVVSNNCWKCLICCEPIKSSMNTHFSTINQGHDSITRGKGEPFTAIKLSGNMRCSQIKRHVRVNENRYWQPSYDCLFAHEHAVGSLDGKILNIPKLIASFRHYLFYSFRIECKALWVWMTWCSFALMIVTERTRVNPVDF